MRNHKQFLSELAELLEKHDALIQQILTGDMMFRTESMQLTAHGKTSGLDNPPVLTAYSVRSVLKRMSSLL